jgi:ABC-type multidrug transport system ATPase subunit
LLAERDGGHGVLLVSSELSEILALADRVLVMYEGRIVHETARAAADERTLGCTWRARAGRSPGRVVPKVNGKTRSRASWNRRAAKPEG